MMIISWRHGKVERMSITFNMRVTIPTGSKYHAQEIIELLRQHYDLHVELSEYSITKAKNES